MAHAIHAVLVLFAGGPALALDDGQDDQVLAFCQPLAEGCACSIQGIETLLEPAEAQRLLLAMLRADALTEAEFLTWRAGRDAACAVRQADRAVAIAEPATPMAGPARRNGWRHRREAAR